MLTIENDQLRVEINELGAEITHIWNKNGNFDYIWNDSLWPKHAPILFPSIGRSVQDKYMYDGDEYPMDQHGFAQGQKFDVIKHENNKVLFELDNNSETEKSFPFKFSLQVQYELQGGHLSVSFNVNNLDQKTFSFSLGAHPAFNVPIDGVGRFEDYQLLFTPKLDELNQYEIIKNPYPYRTGNLLQLKNYSNGTINLNHEMFEAGLVIIENQGLDHIILCSDKSQHQIKMNIKDFRYLCLWTKEGANAPFLCIEPFQGLPDIDNKMSDLLGKEANVVLEPNENKMLTYSIEFK
ncbi:aldose 1-epimerase family protein [Weissella kandleri]|uniref:aldose 1-epimerase family protein n=1 Tax=Weissella kandleri TaxID=1616 RepID=UPI00387E9F56